MLFNTDVLLSGAPYTLPTDQLFNSEFQFESVCIQLEILTWVWYSTWNSNSNGDKFGRVYRSHGCSLFCTGMKFDFCAAELKTCESRLIPVRKSEPPWCPQCTVCRQILEKSTERRSDLFVRVYLPITDYFQYEWIGIGYQKEKKELPCFML